MLLRLKLARAVLVALLVAAPSSAIDRHKIIGQAASSTATRSRSTASASACMASMRRRALRRAAICAASPTAAARRRPWHCPTGSAGALLHASRGTGTATGASWPCVKRRERISELCWCRSGSGIPYSDDYTGQEAKARAAVRGIWAGLRHAGGAAVDGACQRVKAPFDKLGRCQSG